MNSERPKCAAETDGKEHLTVLLQLREGVTASPCVVSFCSDQECKAKLERKKLRVLYNSSAWVEKLGETRLIERLKVCGRKV